MSSNAEERAYCVTRIAAATKLALASTDSCVRAAHAGTALAYRKRLAMLQAVPLAAHADA